MLDISLFFTSIVDISIGLWADWLIDWISGYMSMDVEADRLHL